MGFGGTAEVATVEGEQQLAEPGNRRVAESVGVSGRSSKLRHRSGSSGRRTIAAPPIYRGLGGWLGGESATPRRIFRPMLTLPWGVLLGGGAIPHRRSRNDPRGCRRDCWFAGPE